jgi:hypothetical protein
MLTTKKNLVFKYFLILCAIISAFVIYFIADRPAKIVLEGKIDDQLIVFFYQDRPEHPSFDQLQARKDDGKHVILVLLTDKKVLLKNTDYQTLLNAFDQCEVKNFCPVFSLSAKEYLDVAKERKDI